MGQPSSTTHNTNLLPSLTHLSWSSCRVDTIQDVFFLLSRSMQQLETIILCDMTSNDTNETPINNNTADNNATTLGEALAHKTRLTSIDLSNNQTLTDQDLYTWIEVINSTRAADTSSSLSSTSSSSSSSLVRSASRVPLRYLNLSSCPAITNVTLAQLILALSWIDPTDEDEKDDEPSDVLHIVANECPLIDSIAVEVALVELMTSSLPLDRSSYPHRRRIQIEAEPVFTM